MKTPACRRQQCLLSGIIAVMLVTTVRANELRNPSFEEGFPYWWSYNNVQVEAWRAYDGTNSAVLPSWIPDGYGGTGQDVGMPARPGDIVTYSVYGYAEQNYISTTADTFLQVEFWINGASSASQVNKALVYTQLDANRQAWILLTMTVTNTLNNVTMVKGLFGGGGWTNAGGNMACFMDNAALTPSTRNLLVDPGFENGSGWWTYSDAGREWWAAQSGRTGVAFYAWNEGAYGGIGQDVEVNQNNGHIYEFSIWGLAEANYSSLSHETWLKLELYDGATLKQTVQKDIYAALTGTLNTWQLFTLTVTNTTDTITKITPMVGGAFWNNTGGNQSAKWDNGYLRQINDGVVNPSDAEGFAGNNEIDLVWANNANGDNVMVAYSTDGTFGTPGNDTSYNAGAAIAGGGTVIYNSAATMYDHTGLNPNTDYYYKFWSVDGNNYYSPGISIGPITTTPEPGMMALAGLALVALRRKSKSGVGN